MAVQVVVLCGDCGLHWFDGAAAECVEPGHREGHQRFSLHRHLDVVVLPDGTAVTAASFAAAPYARDVQPDFGLYLDAQWAPPWAHERLDWPDFGVPADAAAVVGALRSLLDRARRGETVELGCVGGHGRTGTALACLAVLAGCPAGDAVAWVRSNYCDKAVETPEQEAFVAALVV